MEVGPSCRQAEVDNIPEDWEVKELWELVDFTNGKAHEQNISAFGGFVVVNSRFVSTGGAVRKFSVDCFCPAKKGDVLMVMSDVPNGRALAKCYLVDCNNYYTVNQRICALRPRNVHGKFLFYKLDRNRFYLGFDDGAKQTNLRRQDVLSCPLELPKSLLEQQAIATALSDTDAYIESLEQLITKKRQIKQGVMQELLTGKRRLSGFEGGWTTSLMVDLAECLDHLRIPLNDSERSKMRGAYPYCGANGVLDYIDRYCVDDRVVLIAEDGGYYDEYATRPIAYRMSGRFWVNNHAHILKSKDGFNQDFLFYSLVHKNVLNFLASGTRAKLNKSELLKIPIYHPVSTEEQNQISNCLNDIDGEIAALETKVGKVRDLKQAMMQQLLTGKIRLV